MAVTVEIGRRLSEFTSGEMSFTVEGATLGEVIGEIDARHPGFRNEIFAGDHVRDRLHVAGARYPRTEWAGDPVDDGSVISIVTNMPGG